MKKEYRPILVLYTDISIQGKEFVNDMMERIKRESGYPVMIFHSIDNQRAEIISVDKSTVVEDIQKYIDLKLKKDE